MAVDTAVADRLAEAAVEQAALDGWARLSLVDVARHADVPLAEAYAAVPDKAALLQAILDRTNRHVLADGPAEEGEPTKDRLFEILMRRFDVLQANREGYRAVLQGLPADPVTSLRLLPHMATSMGWMLETAQLSSSGLVGNLRIKGLALVYVNALRTWMDDDSEDMARTMEAVDTGLRQAETWAERLSRLTGRGPFRWDRGDDDADIAMQGADGDNDATPQTGPSVEASPGASA